MLILSILHKWATRQLDFVLAFPQAAIETELFMEIPVGIDLDGKDKKKYVLLLVKNLYGQKQASRVWFKHLKKGLSELGFEPSKTDDCVFYKEGLILMIYVDDCLVASKDPAKIDDVIDGLQSKFDMTDEGDITDYLGVNIEYQDNGDIHLTQPSLIDAILEDLNFLNTRTKTRIDPMKQKTVLNKDEQGEDHQADWKYRSVIGKLNFLEKSTRPEIAFAVHNCARFMERPKKTHTEAIHDIGRYLLGTRDKGIIIRPNEESLECFVDADFTGLWDKERAEHDRSSALSRTGFIVKYAGCPILWSSKLQTEVSLSTTSAEYVALSAAVRETLPIVRLLGEFYELNMIDDLVRPKLHCKIFEDNAGALELATSPKMRPRTKYLNTKYHHCRDHIVTNENPDGLFTVHAISTEDQQADILTKAVSRDLFLKFRRLICGW